MDRLKSGILVQLLRPPLLKPACALIRPSAWGQISVVGGHLDTAAQVMPVAHSSQGRENRHVRFITLCHSPCAQSIDAATCRLCDFSGSRLNHSEFRYGRSRVLRRCIRAQRSASSPAMFITWAYGSLATSSAALQQWPGHHCVTRIRNGSVACQWNRNSFRLGVAKAIEESTWNEV